MPMRMVEHILPVNAVPEASLSLLYPKYLDENVLRGKTVPLEVVEERFTAMEKSLGRIHVDGIMLKD